jgi:predicted phosphodiesterase
MLELKNEVTGIISDTQFPGHMDTALEFVLDTGSDWGVTQWIHIGDMIDHHYISRHPIEFDAWNPVQEILEVKIEVAKWVKAIKNLFICRGNHDLIPQFRAASLGMPDLFLKTLNEVYDLPDTWIWDDRFKLFDRTIVFHGMGSNGMYGIKNTANKWGCGAIQGHTHSNAAVFDLPRPLGNCMAMNVGCLADEDKYNARYAKHYFTQPVSLGMGIACADDEMHFIKMR